MTDQHHTLSTDESSTAPRAPRVGRLDAYVAVVALVAVAAVALLVGWTGFAIPRPQRALFAVFASLLVIGELRTFKWLRLDEGGETTTTWAFAVGLLLLGTPGAAVLTILGASTLADLVHRKPLVRVAFNAAQLTLSLAIAAFVLQLTGNSEILPRGGTLGIGWFASFLVAGGALFFANGALTCTALALHERTSIRGMVRRGLFANMSTDGALLALSPCFVVVAERSLLLLPLALVTAGIVYRSSRAALASEHAASHDVMTGLLNRRAFDQRLAEYIADGDADHGSGALLLIDLDGFKGINDRLGHHAGDQVLQEVARRLTELRRPGQIAARLGGDEFAVLLTRVNGKADAVARARQIHTAITRDSTSNGFPLRVGASIGVATWPDHADTPASLMHAADVAMYQAKRDRTGVQVYEPSNESNEHGRRQLVSELADALERDELVLHYQPQFDYGSGQVIALEALIRWQHPVRGMIPPGEFMPIAEQTELMGPLTRFVLAQALSDVKGWQDEGLQLRVAVNASAANLSDLKFPTVVANLLASSGVGAEHLEIELTENTVVSDPEATKVVLDRLRELGVRLAIDDFGTGYSSLTSLRDLPVQTIKIDRSFVRDMVTQPGDLEIVRTIIGLAHNLGMHTTAEGVEDPLAFARLRQLGCEVAQGYLIARPMPHGEVSGWITDYHSTALRDAS